MDKPIARLIPVQMEIKRRGRRPGKFSDPDIARFIWVEGYQIINPAGAKLFPYLRKQEAKRLCKVMGWAWEVRQHG